MARLSSHNHDRDTIRILYAHDAVGFAMHNVDQVIIRQRVGVTIRPPPTDFSACCIITITSIISYTVSQFKVQGCNFVLTIKIDRLATRQQTIYYIATTHKIQVHCFQYTYQWNFNYSQLKIILYALQIRVCVLQSILKVDKDMGKFIKISAFLYL